MHGRFESDAPMPARQKLAKPIPLHRLAGPVKAHDIPFGVDEVGSPAHVLANVLLLPQSLTSFLLYGLQRNEMIATGFGRR